MHGSLVKPYGPLLNRHSCLINLYPVAQALGRCNLSPMRHLIRCPANTATIAGACSAALPCIAAATWLPMPNAELMQSQAGLCRSTLHPEACRKACVILIASWWDAGWQGTREVSVRNQSRKSVNLIWDNATIKEQVVRSKRQGANQVGRPQQQQDTTVILVESRWPWRHNASGLSNI